MPKYTDQLYKRFEGGSDYPIKSEAEEIIDCKNHITQDGASVKFASVGATPFKRAKNNIDDVNAVVVELAKLLTEADTEAKKTNEYTEASLNALNTAITQAKAAQDKGLDKKTQALEALKAAKAGLVKK